MTAGPHRRAVDLAIVLVRRDLRAGYGGAVLGILWSPVATLVQVLVLSFLFQRVVPLDIDDYPAFLFTGLLSWQLAVATIVGGADSLTANRDLVRRPGFPVRVLPLVAAGGALSGYLLALPVLAVVLLASGRVGITAVALPAVIAVEVLLLLGPAYVVARVNVRFRDVRHVVGIGLGIVFYLTPVFYDLGRVPERWRWIIDLNPLSVPVRLHRQILYTGEWPDPDLFAVGAGIGVVGTAVGLAVLERGEAHLVDDL